MESDSSLYDEYLDACLAGEARAPEEVFAEHPGLDAEVRERITALHRAWSHRQPETLPFERLGDFRLLHRLDTGGMGAVFVAEQESLGRVVALKIMRPEWAGDEHALRRFVREAHTVAQLRHPGVVTVYDAGTDGDTPYLAMELVPGTMMADVLAEAEAEGRRLPVERVVRWGARLARALDYAHGRGIVHRDVKPNNIRITPDDRPLLLDFGIARDLTRDAATVTDSFQGSPAYAAPEQILGETIDARTDVYGLGVTLYQALTGAVPFQGPGVEAIFHKVLTELPVPPRRLAPGISADVETVVLKAMEKRPGARYASASAFAEDLEAVLEFRPVSARPPGPIARAAKWARRKPARAVGVASAVIFLLVLATMSIVGRALERKERLAEARHQLDQARETVASYRKERFAAEAEETRLARQREEVNNRYFTLEEDRALARLRRSVEERRRRREALFHEVLAALQRAERLDPSLDGTDAVRAELYIEKWEEARAARDPANQAFFRRQAELVDPRGVTSAPFARTGTVQLAVTTPGASCWLFALREQAELDPEGERRLVPVPLAPDPTPPVPYGATVLRIVRGLDALEPGDLVLSIAGQRVGDTVFVVRDNGTVGVLEAIDDAPVHCIADVEELASPGASHRWQVDGQPYEGPDIASHGMALHTPAALAERGNVAARVLTRGRVQELQLPEGLEVRPTATPLLCTSRSKVEPGSLTLPEGTYLLVARARGHEESRHALHVVHDVPVSLDVELREEGTTPPGFVYVPADRKGDAFLVMEREVTCAEYLEFLQDPAVYATIEPGQRRLVPRGPMGAWEWSLDEAGFHLAPPWTPDTPVMGVTFDDALAYARWRGGKDGNAYTLPTEQQWNRASGHWTFLRLYPFGNVFAPKWVSSNWARPRARPEPTLRYPVDESPWGIYGMSGSAMEWLDAWWDKDTKEQRWLAGGAWGYANPAVFLSPGGWGSRPDRTTGTYGFRLVRVP